MADELRGGRLTRFISYPTFTLAGDNERVMLNMPSSYGYTDGYDITMYNLWSDIIVNSNGKSSNQLVLSGTWQGYSSVTTKYTEGYTSLTYNWCSLYMNQWMGQTFTIGNASENNYFRLSHVSFYLKRNSTKPVGTASVVYCYLRNVLTGANVSSGTILASAVGTSSSWKTIAMSPDYLLCPKSTYALVLGSTATTTGIIWVDDNNMSTYAGGYTYHSTDGGLSWVIESGFSLLFRVFGYREERPYNIFNSLDNLIGQTVTLDGFNNVNLDTTWVIGHWGYSTSGDPCCVDWDITLEKA